MSNLIKEEIGRISELMGIRNKININEDRGDYINALKTILGKTERELADEDILRRALSDALNNPSIRKQVTSATYDVTKRVLGDSFTKIENKIYKDLLNGVPLKDVNANLDNMINKLVASGSIKGLSPEMTKALKQELKDRATKISKGKTAEEVFGRKISKPKSTSSSTDSASKVTKKLSPELERSLTDLAAAFQKLPGIKSLDKTARLQIIKKYQNELTDPNKFEEVYRRGAKNIDQAIAEAQQRKNRQRVEELTKLKSNFKGVYDVSKKVSGDVYKFVFSKWYTFIGVGLIIAAYNFRDLWMLKAEISKDIKDVDKESNFMDIPGWKDVPQDAKDFFIKEFEKPGTDFTISSISNFKVNDKQDNVIITGKDNLSPDGFTHSMSKISSGWKFDY